MRTAAGLSSHAGGWPDIYLDKTITEFVWWVKVVEKMVSDSRKQAEREAARSKKKR
jgi:hypothetical protein